MDPEKRIEELEAQVRELTRLVHTLAPRAGASPPEPSDASRAPRPDAHPHLVRDVRERVDRVLRGDSDASFEAHIGAVWLSRLAVILLMTAVALGAREAFSSGILGPREKVGIGLAMSIAFMAYGFFFRLRQANFAPAVLGCGLAALYFTLYAAFFIEEMRLVHAPAAGIGLLLACLAFMVGVVHWSRSQTVAGIGLFLAYYTVVVSCIQNPTAETLTHALITCGALALVTLIFHYLHQWLLFSWAALIATQITYLRFFLWKPDALDLSDDAYFWISNGLLTICYVMFSITCIVDARKTGEYRRTVAPMAGVNSFVYFTLTWFAIRDHYLEYEWLFRAIFAAILLVFAVFAETTGPKRNYLFQIFIAKTVIMITLAMQAYLSGEILLIAMAIECLGLGFSYKRSGMVVFKVLGLLLMLLTTFGMLAQIKGAGTVTIADFTIQANWFSAIGVSFVFCIVAWFYERFVRPLRPEKRTVSGQWFLADSALDWHGSSLAMAHAAAAAIILLTITILERGEHVTLPYLLAGEGALLAALGLILFTPQIEIACVLLLAAAHVSWHFFLWLPPDTIAAQGFERQPNYVLYTVFFALFTYVGAHGWERYLRRFRRGGYDLEHHIVAAGPYLAATFLLTTLLGRELEALHVPAAMGGLGISLLLVGSITRYTGVKASGVFAMALAAVALYRELYNIQAPLAREPLFLLYFSLFLCTCAAAERLIAILDRYDRGQSKLDDALRTIFVAVMVLFGLLGLYEWSDPSVVVFYLLAHAVAAMSLGAIFRESRYRWGALLLFGVVILQAFRVINTLESPYRELSFGALGLVLLVVSWAYSRTWKRAANEADPPRPGAAAAAPDA